MASKTSEELAATLDWLADRRVIEGNHPDNVRAAAKRLREQAEEIERLSRALDAHEPAVFVEEKEVAPFRKRRAYQFVVREPLVFWVEIERDVTISYPDEVEARRAVAQYTDQFVQRLMPLTLAATRNSTTKKENI